jgi:hypothetical protein
MGASLTLAASCTLNVTHRSPVVALGPFPSNSAAAIARRRAESKFLAVSSVSSIPGSGPGLERRVDEIERDDVAQRRVTSVIVGYDGVRQWEPLVASLRHAFCTRDLDY